MVQRPRLALTEEARMPDFGPGDSELSQLPAATQARRAAAVCHISCQGLEPLVSALGVP